MKRNDIQLSAMHDVVAACCILHNLCETRKDNFLPEWNNTPEEILVQPCSAMPESEGLNAAKLIRSTTAANLAAMLDS